MEDNWMWDDFPLIVCTWKEILCISVIQLKQDNKYFKWHFLSHLLTQLPLSQTHCLHQHHSYMAVEGNDHFQFQTSLTLNIWVPCRIRLIPPHVLVRCNSTVTYTSMLLCTLVQLYQHHRRKQWNTLHCMKYGNIYHKMLWLTLKHVNRCYQICIKSFAGLVMNTVSTYVSLSSHTLTNIRMIFTAEFIDSRTPASLCMYNVKY